MVPAATSGLSEMLNVFLVRDYDVKTAGSQSHSVIARKRDFVDHHCRRSTQCCSSAQQTQLAEVIVFAQRFLHGFIAEISLNSRGYVLAVPTVADTPRVRSGVIDRGGQEEVLYDSTTDK